MMYNNPSREFVAGLLLGIGVGAVGIPFGVGLLVYRWLRGRG